MKLVLGLAALLALTAEAQAGVLPIVGEYCSDDVTYSADGSPQAALMLDANGTYRDDDYPFGKIIKSGSNWWVVTYAGEYGAGVTGRIEISRDKKTIVLVDSDDAKPVTLRICTK